MLSATSIFRRMPIALPLSARRRLGALAYAHDGAELAFLRLKETARTYQFPKEGQSYEEAGWVPESRLRIITDAWACVDNLNRVRNLVQRFKLGSPPPPEIIIFVETMGPAARIRSRLQQLDTDIFEGRYDTEGDPVLGTVSWSDTRGSKGHTQFSIATGPTIEGVLIADVQASGAPRTGDIVDIQLTAAGQSVKLDEMMDALADFMSKFEARISNATTTALCTAAQEQGVPLDQPEPHGVADMTTAVRINTTTDAAWAPTPGDVRTMTEVPIGALDMRTMAGT